MQIFLDEILKNYAIGVERVFRVPASSGTRSYSHWTFSTSVLFLYITIYYRVAVVNVLSDNKKIVQKKDAKLNCLRLFYIIE